MERIPNDSTNRIVYFVAVDLVDLYTRETGLSSFTVDYVLDNGARAQMTSPTTAEINSTYMPGLYSLLVDEGGMTNIDAANDSETLALHITHASIDPITKFVEVYRPKITAGQALTVSLGIAEANLKKVDGDALITETTHGGVGAPDTTCTVEDGTGFDQGRTIAFNLGSGQWKFRIITGYAIVGPSAIITFSPALGEVIGAGEIVRAYSQTISPGIDDAITLNASIAAILEDVTGLNGSVMVGTNGAALASAYTTDRAAYIDTIKNLLEGDWIIEDADTDQFQLIVKLKGTETVLLTKNLNDINGDPITEVTTVIAQQVEV